MKGKAGDAGPPASGMDVELAPVQGAGLADGGLTYYVRTPTPGVLQLAHRKNRSTVMWLQCRATMAFPVCRTGTLIYIELYGYSSIKTAQFSKNNLSFSSFPPSFLLSIFFPFFLLFFFSSISLVPSKEQEQYRYEIVSECACSLQPF